MSSQTSYSRKVKNGEKEMEPEFKEKSITTNYSFDSVMNLGWIRPEIKDYFLKMDKILSPQRKKITDRQVSSINEKGAKPYAIINYCGKNTKKILFPVVILRSQINIYGTWPSKISQNLSELLSNYSIKYRKEKHQGIGDWHFPPIKNKNDFQKLKDFFQEYKEQFSENSEMFK